MDGGRISKLRKWTRFFNPEPTVSTRFSRDPYDEPAPAPPLRNRIEPPPTLLILWFLLADIEWEPRFVNKKDFDLDKLRLENEFSTIVKYKDD